MKKIKILCANGLEECEALLIYDLLKRAKFDVQLVNIHNEKEVLSSHGLTFKTDVELSNMENDYDGIFLPGGLVGSDNLRKNETVINTIKKAYADKKLVTAVCAAPDILAEIGLVNDLEFTCYPGCDHHKKASDKKTVQKENIITGKALGACFNLAYEIINYFQGKEYAQSILDQVHF